MIFKNIQHGRPYPDHGLSTKDWAQIPPHQVHLAELITTATVVELDAQARLGRDAVARRGMAERVEFRAGDLFEIDRAT